MGLESQVSGGAAGFWVFEPRRRLAKQGERFMVFDFLKRSSEVPEQKASATGPVVAFASSGRVAWSPRDTVSLVRTGFAGNPVGFRAVKLIAEAAAALPLVLQDQTQRFEAHPIWDVLKRPNPGQGKAELLEALYAQLLL